MAAATARRASVRLDDGTEMRPKGWQHCPAGRRLILELPGGGGYGEPQSRPRDAIERDIRNGHVTAAEARREYDWDDDQHAPDPAEH